ncbi:chromosome partitioning protein ParB (plasmid) [Salmonella enterica]|nr:chromosome partitioning protein ParB [Salmonella enterica]
MSSVLLWCFPSAPVVTPAIPAHLMLTATRCQCAASGLSRDGRWRRCDCTPYPRQFKGALQAAFAA